MKYRIDYQLTHDIDWFAVVCGIPIHVASNGNILPNEVDSKINRQIQKRLAEIHLDTCDVSVGQEVTNVLGKSGDLDFYLETFVEYASMGFVSIDSHKVLNERGSIDFRPVIVAYPSNRNKLIVPEAIGIHLPILQNEQYKSQFQSQLNLSNLW